MNNTRKAEKARNKRKKNNVLCKGYAGIVTARAMLKPYVTNFKTNGRSY